MTDHKDEEKMGKLIHMHEQGPSLGEKEPLNGKVCSKCGFEKPATAGYFATYKFEGDERLRGICRECRQKQRNASKKKSRKKDPKKHQAIGRAEQKKLRRKLGMKDQNEHRKERLVSKTKICSKCKEEKLKEAFAKGQVGTIDNRSSWCKDCNNTHSVLRRDKEYWASRLVGHARDRHRKMGFSIENFDITTDALHERFESQQGLCFWYNLPMTTERRSGSLQVSLDRLDCYQGYTLSNVVLTCKSANLARNVDSAEDFEIMLEMLTISLQEKVN